MGNIQITFTLNEAQVLTQLIDAAIKSQGLGAAEAGVFLTKKIQQAFQEAGGDGAVLGSQGSDGTDGASGDASGPITAFPSSGPSGPTGP